MEVRLAKILELILTCRYGLTDLSYVTRMNMPLELGLLLALGKETFVMSRTRYGALKTVSDMNFTDIYYHEGSVRKLILGFAAWIEGACGRDQLSTHSLLQRYRRFRRLRESLGADFDRLKPQQVAALLPVAREEFGFRLPHMETHEA
ncbi:MAG: hypothetical protein ACRD5W_15365 [Candidatus Acidiferrales bacterium]